MERQKWFIAMMWVIVVALLVWASISLISTLSKFAPPIIAGMASIFVASLNHFYTQQRELKLQHQKEKQKNYENLLKVAADLIRDPNNKDIWDTIHLYSWVVGSNEVVHKTQNFTNQKDDKSLRLLLDAMRNDIGLEKIDDEALPNVFEHTKEGYLKRSNIVEKKTSRFSFWPK